jgi:hypothetical protein
MNKIMKCAAVFAAITFSVSNVSAQENFGSAGLEIAIPMGDFGDVANFGIGGSGTFEYGLSDKLALLGHVGVIFYAADDIEVPVVNPDLTVGTESFPVNVYQVPLQIGGRFYLEEQKSGLFLSGLLGLHITGISVDGEGESSTDFSLAPEVGYFLNESISLALRYQIVTGDDSNADYLGIRAAYNF